MIGNNKIIIKIYFKWRTRIRTCRKMFVEIYIFSPPSYREVRVQLSQYPQASAHNILRKIIKAPIPNIFH